MTKDKKAALQEIEEYVNNNTDIRLGVLPLSVRYNTSKEIVIECQGWWKVCLDPHYRDFRVVHKSGTCLGEPDIKTIYDLFSNKDKIYKIWYREAA